MRPLISARQLTRVFQRGSDQVRALDDVSFDVFPGEFLAIVGPSGSGKSTLLNLLGAMDRPTSGALEIGGQELNRATEKEKTHFRRKCVGFVFQHFGLIPSLSVEENIRLPHLFAGGLDHEDVSRLIGKVGLTARRRHFPHELSGGEMQRTAIARALYNRPKLLLADEPTGNLDSETGKNILELFGSLNAQGLTIIVVTHNRELAQAANRQIELRDGRIVS